MLSKIKKVFDNPRLLLIYATKKLGFLLSDKLYLKLLYYGYMGKRLNLKNPQTLNEKLQWLKLYNHRPEYTTMVDKYAVKKYVADIIGKEYIIPTLGVWDSFDEIDFDSLPNQFVLKTTHGGGNTGVVICKDKSTFNKEAAKAKLNRSLKSCIYKNFREYPYKNVPKRIIAEKYMEDETGELRDFKFYCFKGYVDCVLYCFDRNSGDTKFYFFDKEWKLKRYNKRGKAAPENFTLPKPENIEKMFDLASILSKELPYARVDFYNINGQIYFGEITFFPAGGFDYNRLPEMDLYFGNLVDLNNIKKAGL